MVFLSALRRRPDAAFDRDCFPWTLPVVRDLETLTFTEPVTFLVGENGSGKSTLLEGIAAGMDAVAAGARDLQRDPTLQAARDFAAGFVFARRRHARTRLFLRAEDVFGYTGRLTGDIAELGEIEQDLAKLPEGSGRDRDGAWRACGPDKALWRQSRRALAWRDIPGPAANAAGAERSLLPRRTGDTIVADACAGVDRAAG